MGKGIADGYSAPLGATISVSGDVTEVEASAPAAATTAGAAATITQTATEPIHTGGGWYSFTDTNGEQQKRQGREAAYEAAGIPLPQDEE